MTTNAAQFVLETPTTVISLAATLTANSWTYSGLTGCTMTTLDNSTVKCPHLRLVLDIPDTFSAAPNAGAYANVYMLVLNSDGTNDDLAAPDSAGLKAARLIDSIPIHAHDVGQRITRIIPNAILGVTHADFSLENKTGVSMSYTTNPITLKATPLSLVPSA